MSRFGPQATVEKVSGAQESGRWSVMSPNKKRSALESHRVDEIREQIFDGWFGKQLWPGIRQDSRKTYMHTRRCNVLRSALGASFLVILGRFWSGRWGGQGVGGRLDAEKPPRLDGRGGFGGLG